MWVGVHIRSAVPGSHVISTAERETDVAHAHHTQCAHSGGSRELHRTVPHTRKDQLIACRIKIFERLGGHIGEIVTVSVHKTQPDATSLYDVIASFHSRGLLPRR